jgi:hypothetical protein
MMELEMPTEAVCPLCRDETVTLNENKSGRPYFTCRTFDSTVNLRPGGKEQANTILNELQEAELADSAPEEEPTEVDQPEDDDDDGPTTATLKDMLNGDDDA